MYPYHIILTDLNTSTIPFVTLPFPTLRKTISPFKDPLLCGRVHFRVVGSLGPTYLHNRLKTTTIEVLQVVKSAFCNGIHDACNEAAAHVAAEWDFGRLIDKEDNAGPV